MSTGPWNPPASRETYERVRAQSLAREPRQCSFCESHRVLYMMNPVGTRRWLGACSLHRMDLVKAAFAVGGSGAHRPPNVDKGPV